MCRHGLQPRQGLGRVTDRIGARVDGEHPRVLILGAAEPASGVDEDAASSRSRICPPRPGDRQPQQPDVQVAIAGVSRPLGRVDHPGDALCVAEVGRVDHLLDPGHEGALHRAALRVDLAQQRRGKLGLTELYRQLAGRQQAPRLAAQASLSSAARRSAADRHMKGAAAARAPTRLLELHSHLLVVAGDERGAVPDPTVGLALQRLRQRLMHTPSLLHAGALAYRRAHQRMSEAHRALVELHDRHVSRGLEGFDAHR